MPKILSIFGTSPEATKMAPVIKEIKRRPDDFTSIVCVAAQHREMLDQVLSAFKIRLNPNVYGPVRKTLGNMEGENIFLIDPVEYLPFVYLMNRSYMIVTDSGGIQEGKHPHSENPSS